jgi:hypothetical protein
LIDPEEHTGLVLGRSRARIFHSSAVAIVGQPMLVEGGVDPERDEHVHARLLRGVLDDGTITSAR